MGWLSRHHIDACDAPFGGCNYCVQSQQCSARHENAAAIAVRQIDQIEIVEQRPAAQHHDNAPAAERRLRQLAQYRSRRALDDDIGVLAEPGQWHDRHALREPRHCRCRARGVARRNRGERQAVDALIETAGNNPPDRAKPADRNGQCHLTPPRLKNTIGSSPGKTEPSSTQFASSHWRCEG